MSADSCRGCARILAVVGAVLISPIAAIVGLVVLVMRGVDLMLQRRAGAGPGQDPDRGSAWPVLAVLGVVLVIVLAWRR
jgi:UPF0716 family protein affecting phage T7 exclusion